jgi:hypothetical protein
MGKKKRKEVKEQDETVEEGLLVEGEDDQGALGAAIMDHSKVEEEVK